MFLLAGFQVFCARVANTLLTSWSPLTYELGDYSDGTEKLDPDWEPETLEQRIRDAREEDIEKRSECKDAIPFRWHGGRASAFSDVLDMIAYPLAPNPEAVPPAASAPPAPVDGTPPASPGAGLSFVDYMTPAIWDVLAVHMPIRFHVTEFGVNHFRCECGYDFPGVGDGQDWREHVGELIAERIERAGGKR